MGDYYEQPFKIVEHGTFRSIGDLTGFWADGEYVIEVVEKHFGKVIAVVERLDKENTRFEFTDGSEVELLIRPAKYCSEVPDVFIPQPGDNFFAEVEIDWTGGNKPANYVPQKYKRDYIMVADGYDDRNVRVLTIREGEGAPFEVDVDWFNTDLCGRAIGLNI